MAVGQNTVKRVLQSFTQPVKWMNICSRHQLQKTIMLKFNLNILSESLSPLGNVFKVLLNYPLFKLELTVNSTTCLNAFNFSRSSLLRKVTT